MLIHTHHVEVPCIELIDTVCHSLSWLWNPSSLLAAPISIFHLFRVFLNIEHNLRAFGNQKRSQISFYHPQDHSFFFFFPFFLKMVNKVPLAESHKRTMDSFSTPSYSVSCKPTCQPATLLLPQCFYTRTLKRSGTNDGKNVFT